MRMKSTCSLCREDKAATIGVLLCADCTLDAILGKAVRAALTECGMANKNALVTLAAMNAQCGSEPEVGYILDAIAAALEAENENV